MTQKQTTQFEIYLTKGGQNNLAKGEMIALLQLLRITNALRFHTSLLLNTKNEKDKLFRLRAQLEVSAILGSSYAEAVKEFYSNLYKKLEHLSDDNELKEQINQYGNKTKNYKSDEVLKVIHYIRHVFSFHMDPKLFKDYIIEGSAEKDMLVGIAKSEKVIDQCYLKAYDALIFQISWMVTNLTDEKKVLDWLFNAILRETDHFCSLIENFAGSIMKKYGGKKLVSHTDD